MKKTVKILIGALILLFCMSDLQAQYTVHNVKGTVEMSIDGKTWTPLKKKDELKESYQIRLLEKSSVDIKDSNNFVYRYENPETISVGDIEKQKKSIFDVINEKSSKHKALAVADRGVKIKTIEPTNDKGTVRLRFKETESGWYDCKYWDSMPTQSVFYITILNETGEEKVVNVYQELENGKRIPCFPEIRMEKYTSIEITELFFVKQEKNTFIVVPVEK